MNASQILVFTPNEDDLVIHTSAFGGGLVPEDVLSETQLVATDSAAAVGAQGQFLYDTNSGALYWDADETSPQDPVQLANLDGAPLLSTSDFDLAPAAGRRQEQLCWSGQQDDRKIRLSNDKVAPHGSGWSDAHLS